MKTMTPRSDAPAGPVRPRLRQLCAAAVVVPALALAACSGESGVSSVSSQTTSGSAASTAPETSAPATSATTTAPAAPATTTAAPTTPPPPTTPALPVDKTRYTDLQAVIKDPELGHTITATRLARQLTWPAGQPVGAQQFEIVGVRVRFQAGARYSATLEPGMLALIAGNPAQTVAPTNEFAGRWQAAPLTTANRATTTSGWVFFKINRGITTPLKLQYSRPAYSVSTTAKSFPAKTFTVALGR